MCAVQKIQRIRELEVAVLLAGRGPNDLLRLLLCRLAGEVARQIGFAQPQKLLRVLIVTLAHRIVWNNAGCLNRMSGGRVVAGSGEPQRAAAVAEGNDRLA